MKKMVDIAISLTKRLSDFGRSAESVAVIERAIEANAWFAEGDICRSVEAIRSQMLDPHKISAWLAAYPAPPRTVTRRIAIIMAGNIPLVGIFDLICTLASGHEAWIKPSSKDSVLIEYICALLQEIDPDIPIYIYDESQSYDAFIATGGEEANLYFTHRYQGVKQLCRSNRHSIAVLNGDETSEQLDLLAHDIYTYSGLGCRNVAMIFAPKGHKVEIPKGNVSKKYRNNYMQTKALLTIRGQAYEDNQTSIIIRSQELPTTLSTITLWEYDAIEQVEEWISLHDQKLQCIVSNVIKHPRQVDFGQAQHPTLFDYADGVDTMKFLDFND
ncbi:MAG: acyl-CoA reductase [Rikenellaceae bacterium]